MAGVHAMLFGAAKAATVTLNDMTYYGYALDTTATATVSLSAAGVVTGSMGTTYNWLDNGLSSNYEVRATATSNTFNTGTNATWQSLSSSRTWTVTRTAVGIKTTVATFEIRDATSLAVLATATITLTAQYDTGGGGGFDPPGGGGGGGNLN